MEVKRICQVELDKLLKFRCVKLVDLAYALKAVQRLNETPEL